MEIPVALLSATITIIGNLFIKLYEPKSRLVIWRSNQFEFNLPDHQNNKSIPIYVESVRVDNLGRKAANTIEIVHRLKPDYFAFNPPLTFQEQQSPNGEHIITIPSLPVKSGFDLHYFCHTSYPNMIVVRTTDGDARVVRTIPVIPPPSWRRRALKLLILTGATTIIYFVINGVILLKNLL